MGNLIASYEENKMALSPKAFIQDTLDHKKIADMGEYDAIKSIALFCAVQPELMRIKNPVEDFMKQEIKFLILKEFKRLSVNELYYAFQNERFGFYGELTPSYGYFDSTYVAQILRKYKNWKIEQRKKHNLSIGKTQQNISTSEEEKKRLILNGVLDCYDFYKEHYLIQDGKTYVYDVLYDLDLLPKDPKTKNECYKEAKNIIKINLENKIGVKDRNDYRYIKSQLEIKHSDLVVRQAKHIMIGRYFRKTKRKDIIDILTKNI